MLATPFLKSRKITTTQAALKIRSRFARKVDAVRSRFTSEIRHFDQSRFLPQYLSSGISTHSVVRHATRDINTAAQLVCKLVAGGDLLLFMVVAKHTAEDCPGGLVRRDLDFIAKVVEHVERSGVTLVEAYTDAPGHVWFLVMNATDNEALNNALEPFRLVGMVRTHPVLKLSDMTAWTKKIGIQQ